MATKYTAVDVDKDNESSDQLEFHDIPHSISMEEEIDTSSMSSGKKVQTHTFTKFPHPDESDDEDGDKADLLTGEKKSASFWTFEYYQNFFDVDTFQVMRRILGSAVPNPRTNFLEHHIRPNPDMYGPFWICTTLVFTTAIAGNMANYFQQAGYIHHTANNFTWHYDFHKVTFAATAVFSYWWVIPTILFGLLWWRGSRAGYTYLEIICVYGYSIAIYIPISILFVIPYNWLHWILVLIGMLMSGTVLLFTFWPAVRDDDKKIAIIVMGFIMVFHGLLATGFVLYFFHVPSSPAMAPVGPSTTALPSGLTGNGMQAGVIPKSPNKLNMSGANRLLNGVNRGKDFGQQPVQQNGALQNPQLLQKGDNIQNAGPPVPGNTVEQNGPVQNQGVPRPSSNVLGQTQQNVARPVQEGNPQTNEGTQNNPALYPGPQNAGSVQEGNLQTNQGTQNINLGSQQPGVPNAASPNAAKIPSVPKDNATQNVPPSKVKRMSDNQRTESINNAVNTNLGNSLKNTANDMTAAAS